MPDWVATRDDRTGFYTITHKGHVQPFGAIFFGERTDVKSVVERAMRRLNRGLVTFRGGPGRRTPPGGYCYKITEWSMYGVALIKGIEEQDMEK